MPAGSVLFRNGRKRRMNMTKEELKQLPKVELHCHLDGSLSREFIEKRLGRQVSQDILRNLTSRADASWTNRDLRKPVMMYFAA